jgi:hypothetical protein
MASRQPHPNPQPHSRPRRPHPGPAAAAVLRVTGAAGRRLVAAARSEPGRRLARAVVVTAALAVVVVTLYDRGEVPTAAAQPAVGAAAGGAPPGPAAGGGAGPDRRRQPEDRGGLRGRPRPRAAERPTGRPAEAAAAWYAARHHLPRARVKPLQQDRLSAREVRVLVLADLGRGRLRTALVRVRLGSAGWSVR